MYDTMIKGLSWPHRVSNVNQMVRNCETCARSRVRFKQKWYLQMLPASGLLTFNFLDILGSLPGKTMSTHSRNVFLGHWTFPYRLTDHLLTNNGPQFVRSVFAELCGFLRLKDLTSTEYHPQTNLQGWQTKKTTVTPLRYYVDECRDNRDVFFQNLPFAYDTQVHRCKGVSPFSSLLWINPSGLTAVDFPSANPSDLIGSVSPRILGYRRFPRLTLMRDKVDSRVNAAPKRYKYDYEKWEREKKPDSKTNEFVYVDRPPLVVSTKLQKPRINLHTTSCCHRKMDFIAIPACSNIRWPSMRTTSRVLYRSIGQCPHLLTTRVPVGAASQTSSEAWEINHREKTSCAREKSNRERTVSHRR